MTMPQALATVPQSPKVFTRDGEVFANSIDVAAYFEKAPNNVSQAIRRLIRSSSECAMHFHRTLIEVSMPKGGTRRSYAYEMTRDGFTLVAMGFTTAAAVKFKLKYIAAFNEMEAALRRPAPIADLNDPSFLRQTLLGYTEKVIALESKVAEQKAEIAVVQPKAAAWDAYKDASGLYVLSDVGRILGTGPQRTIGWMLEKGLLFRSGRKSPLRPMERYKRKGWFDTKSVIVDNVERIQTYVTPRGLAEIAEMMGRPMDLFGQIDRSSQPLLLPN